MKMRGGRNWFKDDHTPVGEADYAIDALLKRRLLAAMPDCGWLSEETADDLIRLTHRRVFVVDAIDGTRDYLRGRAGWAISVALVEDGAPVAAVLDAPAQERVYTAGGGQGARLNGALIAPSQHSTIEGARVPADALSRPLTAARAAAVQKPNSLALRMMEIAAARADLFLERRPLREYDIAAAALIAAEAGCAVTDLSGTSPRFNVPGATVPGMIAANPALHAATLDWLARR